MNIWVFNHHISKDINKYISVWLCVYVYLFFVQDGFDQVILSMKNTSHLLKKQMTLSSSSSITRRRREVEGETTQKRIGLLVERARDIIVENVVEEKKKEKGDGDGEPPHKRQRRITSSSTSITPFQKKMKSSLQSPLSLLRQEVCVCVW